MARFVPGNRVTLLEGGGQYYPDLERAIDEARQEIYLETYIFAPDATGRRFAARLAAAARRGVAVQVLVDGFGSKRLDPAIIAAMTESGAVVMRFRPDISPWTFQSSRLRRLHRKLAVIDARIAFVGGLNINDDYEDPEVPEPRFDFAVRIEGPVVDEVHASVRRLWTLVKLAQLRRRRPVLDRAFTPAPVHGSERVAFLVRDNLRHRRDIEDAYLQAISGAKHEIVLAMAYFFPGADFRHALVEAARRGVRVILLLQGQVDYFLLHYATRALYGALIDAGVEVHEYVRSQLHAKVAVIDGCWATVGSSNIDPFSLLLAREANVVLDDPGFSRELRARLLAALARDARQLRPEQWVREPLGSRLLTWVCYGLVRVLSGMFGYGSRLVAK